MKLIRDYNNSTNVPTNISIQDYQNEITLFLIVSI